MEPPVVLAAAVAATAAAALVVEATGRVACRIGGLWSGVLRSPLRGVIVAAALVAVVGRTGPGSATMPPPLLRFEPPADPDADADAGDPPLESTPDVAPDPKPGAAYRVRPGDSLWAIACRALTEARQEKPTSAAIDRLWREIYRINRHIVGPDPDLIHPGQMLTLPEVG